MHRIMCRTMSVTEDGVTLGNSTGQIHIRFAQCARNCPLPNSSGTCVAVRNIETRTFLFFTRPETEVVIEKRFLKDLISGSSALRRFQALEDAIHQAGFTTFDAT